MIDSQTQTIIIVVIILIIVAPIFILWLVRDAKRQTIRGNNYQVMNRFLAEKNLTNAQEVAIAQDFTMRIDQQGKRLVFLHYLDGTCDMISFHELIGCEVVVNNQTVQKASIGRALVGGALAGGVGAIIGGTTGKAEVYVNELYLRIRTNNISRPQYTIQFVTKPTYYDWCKPAIEKAEYLQSVILAIIASNANPNPPLPPSNNMPQNITSNYLAD